MALSRKALQKKREKKQKKRSDKSVKILASSSITYSHWPVYECWMPENLWGLGLGNIVISRKNHQGDIAVAVFMVDVYCLGVKDCFARVGGFEEYENFLQRIARVHDQLQRIEPSYAATLILQLVHYAQNIGFKPHADFIKISKMLNNIPLDEALTFSFGKEGKPFYMQGPHETPTDVKRIMRTLTALGEGNYHFMCEAPDDIVALIE